MRTYAAIFVTVFLAELGDKTQLATLLLATEPTVSKVAVFLAAAAALLASTLLAVVFGASLGTYLPLGPLRIGAGLGFIAVGGWVLVSGLRR
jgi:putative Ca2+/H+ antiporter (TMEM165/GDT1 family)